MSYSRTFVNICSAGEHESHLGRSDHWNILETVTVSKYAAMYSRKSRLIPERKLAELSFTDAHTYLAVRVHEP
jgi:hypothetical protein